MAVCCNGGFAALVCEREVGILWAAPVCAFGLGLAAVPYATLLR